MDVTTWVRAQWDRVLGFVLVAAGAVELFVGYDKAASTRYLAEQITVLISGGLGGIFCLGAGATLLVCADIRDEWRKLDRIEEVLRDIRDDLGLPRSADQDISAAGPDGPDQDRNGALAPRAASREAPAAPEPRPARLHAASEHRAAAPDAAPEHRQAGAPLVGRPLALVAGLLGVVGLGLMVGGWESSASTAQGSTALGAAGWSGAGVVLAGLGAAALIVGLKRSVRLREMAVLAPVVMEGARRAAQSRTAVTGTADGSVRFAAGLTHFHRPGCSALRGLDSDACDRAVAVERLAPCPLCEP